MSASGPMLATLLGAMSDEEAPEYTAGPGDWCEVRLIIPCDDYPKLSQLADQQYTWPGPEHGEDEDGRPVIMVSLEQLMLDAERALALLWSAEGGLPGPEGG